VDGVARAVIRALAGMGSSAPAVLCIGAHSDDLEIGCGGTVLRILQEYPEARVHWVVLGAAADRRAEAQASAEALLAGADACIEIAEFEDRFFPQQQAELKRFFDRLGRSLAPDLILTHHRADLHQDHRTVAELSWETFRNHLILEYEIPKYDGDLGQPNAFVELPRELAVRKIDHLLHMFPTQTSKYWFTDETFWATLRLRGVECRAGSGYAEAFHARKLLLM
jgi:LmbE family N-acetylglucosaminyl deacetylase